MKNNVTSSSDRSTTGRFKQLSNILQIVILTFSITFILLLWHLFDNNLKTSSLVIYAVILCSCLVMYMFYWMQKAKYEAIERAEAEFSGLIQRFSFAADSAGIGVWEYLVPENQLIWDKWMYVLYGVREEDFSGAYQAWQHGLHPEDRDRGDDAINSALQGEKDFIIEFRVVWPTGEVRHIKASALVLRDDSGKPLRMIGVNYDITERKLAEEKLRMLSRAVEQCPVSIVITDTLGAIEFVNPKFTELTGYSVEEVMGQNPRILNSGRTPPEVFEGLWQRITSGNTWRGEYENISKDGTQFWESAAISALCDDNGAITHYVAVKEDITEKKIILEQLITAKNAAEAATRAKSDFLAIMSHEIRTPINGVLGLTEILLDTELSGEQRGYAELIRRSGEDLLSLINGILDFSKIEARKLDLDVLDFDLRVTMENAIELLAAGAGDAGLELICRIDPDVPRTLKGDPARLRQVITNLVANAIKFTHEGEVAVSASLDSEEDGYAVIRFEVQDTGIGIPEARRAAIFDLFTQVDSSTTRKYGGSGLGLAICSQLTELMGGKIGVTSEEGKGTVFWFTAHFDKQAINEQHRAFAVEVPQCSSLSGYHDVRVLLVEDNAINQKVTLHVLNKLGCPAEVVVNGLEAVRALELKHYDLVLMDCLMPVMDGYEATTAIRSADSKVLNHEVPIIAMTANAMMGDRERCMAVGMNDYLAKPVRMDELAKVLDTWLVTGSHVEHLVKKSGNPSDTHQLFDEAQLLENFDGDDDFAKGILADALTELPKYIVTLQELFKGEDIQAIHLQAHTIKGIAANLCTPALLIIACQLEMAAKNGSMAETRDLFPELEQTLLMTLEEIRG